MSIVPYIKALWPLPACVNLTTYVQGNSDYEIICQILQKLNETVHSFNSLDDAVTELSSKYDSLKDYVDSEISELKNYIDDKFTSINVRQFVDEVLSDHPEWTTTVQDNSLTLNKFTKDTKLAVENNYVTPQMYGAAGDGATDDTTALQAALNDCYNGKNVLFIPAGDYRISKTLRVNQYTKIYGNRRGKSARIVCPSSIGTCIRIDKTQDYEIDYPEMISISDLSIRFDDYSESTRGIDADTCPYLTLEKLSIANVGRGICINKDTWLTSITDCIISDCHTGFYKRGQGTSCNLSRFYVSNASDYGFDIQGLVYSSLQSCAVDKCRGTDYSLKFFRGTLLSCGSESPSANIALLASNSYITACGCFFYAPTKFILSVNAGTLSCLDCTLGYEGQTLSESTLLHAAGNTNFAIFIKGGLVNCNVKETGANYGTILDIDSTNYKGVIGSGFTTAGVRNISAPAKPGVASPCFGSVMQTDYGNIEWERAAVGGTIIPNVLASSNGVGLYIMTTPNNILSTALTVAGISGNTITLNSDEWPQSVTKISANLTDFDFIKSWKNSYKGTPITAAQGTIITLEDTTGIRVGDPVMVRYRRGIVGDVRSSQYAKVPVINSGSTSSRPTNQVSGVCYFDTTINKPIWWNGSSWIDATGASV